MGGQTHWHARRSRLRLAGVVAVVIVAVIAGGMLIGAAIARFQRPLGARAAVSDTTVTSAAVSAPRPAATPEAASTTTTVIDTLAASSPIAARAPFPVPVVVGDAGQIITVAAADTTAVVQAWLRGADGSWVTVPGLGPMRAYVGRSGVRAAKKEGDGATPTGTFTLTMAFGVGGDPGSGLPYRVADSASYWVSDPASAGYNTWQEYRPGSDFSPSLGEHLAASPTAYRYALVIDYNRFLVTAGAGSAIFLHVEVGRPTSGCVSLSQANVVKILRWLDPARHPRIGIG
jgi:L,D-peptidoglycan transpeptidase YkuD (ErfK/YbiS/YcfS/YnhG family)